MYTMYVHDYSVTSEHLVACWFSQEFMGTHCLGSKPGLARHSPETKLASYTNMTLRCNDGHLRRRITRR